MEISTLITTGGIVVVAAAITYVLIKKGSKEEPGDRKGDLPPTIPPTFLPNPNVIKAKKAFLSHLDDFAPLLPLLTSSVDVDKWTQAIVSVEDIDLTSLWAKYVQAKEIKTKWVQLLASWQVKSDNCKSFTCLSNSNVASYSLPDGGKLTKDVKYKVETPCWVYTYEDRNNQIVKRVISKGIVVPIA